MDVGRNTLRMIAENIIEKCLRIKCGEMVTINTWRHTIELAEELAFKCYEIGAIPLITLMTDWLWFKIMSKVSPEKLSRTPIHVLEGLDGEDVCINIHGPEEPPTINKVNPENMEALRRAYEPIIRRERQLKIRVADIYLGKVTLKRARAYGLNYNEWRKTILNALLVNYDEIKSLGLKISNKLINSNEVSIEDEFGSKLKFKIEGRKPIVDDGIIDENDIELGMTSIMLPAGKVEIAPIENSANGSIIVKDHFIFGSKIRNLRWRFRNGKLIEVVADENLHLFTKFYEKISGDRDRIGRLIIGLNPAMKPNNLFDTLIKGAVSIGIGDNSDIGGMNRATAHYSITLINATLKLDDEVIIENGRIII